MYYIDSIPSNIRSQFANKVSSISEELRINPNWLMQLMMAESGLNPQAKNYQNGNLVAVGLIQFTKPTAEWLGTTHAKLLEMGAINQLDYVRKYFYNYRGKMKDYFDLYLVTFFPAAIGKSDSWVFQTSNLSASLIARQNPAIDINKDGKITMGEFRTYVKRTVPASMQDEMFKKKVV